MKESNVSSSDCSSLQRYRRTRKNSISTAARQELLNHFSSATSSLENQQTPWKKDCNDAHNASEACLHLHRSGPHHHPKRQSQQQQFQPQHPQQQQQHCLSNHCAIAKKHIQWDNRRCPECAFQASAQFQTCPYHPLPAGYSSWNAFYREKHAESLISHASLQRSNEFIGCAQRSLQTIFDHFSEFESLIISALLLKGDMCIHSQWPAGDESTALEAFEEVLRYNPKNARALFSIGLCHARLGCAQTAFDYYKQAADLGHAGAMNNLGFYYEHTCQDFEKASHWYEKSAEAQSSVGMCNAGIFLLQKVRRESDTAVQDALYKKALRYFVSSAASGHVFAMTMVAEMHRNGYGVPISYKKAFSYYLRAASLGHRAAMTAIGFLYYTGSPPNLPLAFSYFAKAAGLGDPSAVYNVAIMIEQGIPDFVEPDLEKARELFTKSADMGYAPAFAALGNVYWRAGIQNHDQLEYVHALSAYETAVGSGYTRATVHLNMLRDTMRKEFTCLGSI